jgi:hypothetical protein
VQAGFFPSLCPFFPPFLRDARGHRRHIRQCVCTCIYIPLETFLKPGEFLCGSGYTRTGRCAFVLSFRLLPEGQSTFQSRSECHSEILLIGNPPKQAAGLFVLAVSEYFKVPTPWNGN